MYKLVEVIDEFKVKCRENKIVKIYFEIDYLKIYKIDYIKTLFENIY